MHKSFSSYQIPKNPEKSLIVPKNDLSTYDKIVFDFTYFKTHSISINGFNNCYKDKKESIDAVSDFFETLKNINSYNKNDFFEPSIKKQFHYNEFTDNKVIDKIEKVLVSGYGMPIKKVNEFERTYFEFSFNDGKRVIGTKIYGNIFSILFLDPNHLICEESSRNVKSKILYAIPTVFSKIENDFLSKEDFNKNEYLKMIVDDYNNGKYNTMNDIIEDLKSIIDE